MSCDILWRKAELVKAAAGPFGSLRALEEETHTAEETANSRVGSPTHGAIPSGRSWL
jgi:hypothetical protein